MHNNEMYCIRHWKYCEKLKHNGLQLLNNQLIFAALKPHGDLLSLSQCVFNDKEEKKQKKTLTDNIFAHSELSNCI